MQDLQLPKRLPHPESRFGFWRKKIVRRRHLMVCHQPETRMRFRPGDYLIGSIPLLNLAQV